MKRIMSGKLYNTESARRVYALPAVGYGLNGRNLARVLEPNGIPFMVIEVNPDGAKRVAAGRTG